LKKGDKIMPRPIQFGANSLVYCVGDKADRIFLLQQGRIWLRHVDIETGEEKTDSVGAGEFFGIKPALGRFPREEDAQVLESAVVLAFSPPEFERMLMSNHRIAMKMLKVFSDQLRRVHAHVSSITQTQYVKPERGLFEIGETYMKRKRYAHAKYIFSRYAELYPEGEKLEDVKRYFGALGKTPPDADRSSASIGAAPEDEAPAGDSALQVDPDLFARFSRSFKPGDIIFSEHEPGHTFYLIQSGSVMLIKNAGQSERTLDVLHRSEMFGEMAILDKSPRTASAFAINDTTLFEFTEANFEILMRGNPQLAVKLLRVFSTRIYNAKRRFMVLTLPDSQAKVADVFLMLDETGASTEGESGLYSREFKVTMDDIAHWAGVPLAETKSALEYYATQRRINIYRDRITVKNINDFSRIVAAKRVGG